MGVCDSLLSAEQSWRDHALFYEYFRRGTGAASAPATKSAGRGLAAFLAERGLSAPAFW